MTIFQEIVVYMRTEVLVIGGGITGLFTALDLSLRGVDVILVERGLIGSGTSGRMHNLIHSGARYVTNDMESAIECQAEGKVLRNIGGSFIKDTGGLFVDLDNDDEFYQVFINGLRKVGITYRELEKEEALSLEPNLNKKLYRAVWVPDAIVYPLNLMTSIAIGAHSNGALIAQHMEVLGFKKEGKKIEKAIVRDKLRERSLEVRADVYVNAAGPWAGIIAEMAGVNVDVLPTAGMMVVLEKQLSNHVINRLRPPSDGDIIVPFNGTSIAGTTANIVDSPDDTVYTEEDITFLIEEASAMMPEARSLRVKGVYSSIRPLVKIEGTLEERKISRKFEVYVHEDPQNLISAIGGKFSTGRLMGERVSDAVARLIGLHKRSQTRDFKLPVISGIEDFREYRLPLAEEVRGVDRLTETSQAIASDDMYIYVLAMTSLIKFARESIYDDV